MVTCGGIASPLISGPLAYSRGVRGLGGHFGAPMLSVGADDVADADRALGQDLGAQTSAMDQAFHHARHRQLVEILARLAQARPAQAYRPDPERAADEMVEWNALRRDVASCLGRRELDIQRLDGLDLDQRDLATALGR